MSFLGYWRVFGRAKDDSDDSDDFNSENTCLLKDKNLFTMLTTKFEIPDETPTETKLQIIKKQLSELLQVKAAVDQTGILTSTQIQELLDAEETEQKRSQKVEKLLDEIADSGLVVRRPVTRAN